MHPPKLYANLCKSCDAAAPVSICFHNLHLSHEDSSLQDIAGFYRVNDELPLQTSSHLLHSEEHAKAFLKGKNAAVGLIRLLDGLSATNIASERLDIKDSFVSCGNSALVGSTASEDVSPHLSLPLFRM